MSEASLESPVLSPKSPAKLTIHQRARAMLDHLCEFEHFDFCGDDESEELYKIVADIKRLRSQANELCRQNPQFVNEYSAQLQTAMAELAKELLRLMGTGGIKHLENVYDNQINFDDCFDNEWKIE